MTKWRKIAGDEPEPNNEVHVLVSDGYMVYLAYRDEIGIWRDTWAGVVMEEFEPTHWMPLPELPK